MDNDLRTYGTAETTLYDTKKKKTLLEVDFWGEGLCPCSLLVASPCLLPNASVVAPSQCLACMQQRIQSLLASMLLVKRVNPAGQLPRQVRGWRNLPYLRNHHVRASYFTPLAIFTRLVVHTVRSFRRLKLLHLMSFTDFSNGGRQRWKILLRPPRPNPAIRSAPCDPGKNRKFLRWRVSYSPGSCCAPPSRKYSCVFTNKNKHFNATTNRDMLYKNIPACLFIA